MWSNESGRTSPLPKAWPKIRANVLRRDNYQCVWVREDTGLPCGARANQVDHMDKGPDVHTHDNLQSLCSYHHKQKTAQQGGTANAAKAKNRITNERHPGFLPVDDE